MAFDQSNRTVGIATPLGENKLLLKSMSGTEHLGRMFRYDLELLSEDPNIAYADILGQNVTIRLELAGTDTRYFNGYINRFSYVGAQDGLARYRATAVPWLWFLTRTADCRIFQEKTVPEIVKQVFRDHGLTDFEESLSGSYRTWEYCVQYRETDFNFVSRLMEQEGMYYYFKQENGKHTMVLSDSASSHDPVQNYETIKYYPPGTGAGREKEYISDWTVDFEIQPGMYALNDFDFKVPTKALVAQSQIPREHAASEFEIYDYPGEYFEYGDGETYSKARIEELHAQHEIGRGATNARGMTCGAMFDLANFPRDDRNKKYLITSASYQLESDAFGSDSGDGGEPFSCSFTVIDAQQPFRPARVTPKPAIQGPQTAIVVGKSGEEIWTDEFGRVKVKFHWDRYSAADENSSCFIRVAQVWAGKKWGAMYIPRIGHEVIVDFLEGDPDRPMIVGRVYNGANTVPYELPANQTLSGIKSNSSKGGGGFNEIRFEDKKGEEQIFVHAEKQMDIRVKESRYETIGAERHLTVGGNKKDKISGEHHDKVEKFRATEIGETLSVTVGGDVSEKFDANHSEITTGDIYLKGANIVIEADTNITLKVGGSHIAIESSGIAAVGSSTMDVEAKVVKVQGKTTTVEGSASTTIKGGSVSIN